MVAEDDGDNPFDVIYGKLDISFDMMYRRFLRDSQQQWKNVWVGHHYPEAAGVPRRLSCSLSGAMLPLAAVTVELMLPLAWMRS